MLVDRPRSVERDDCCLVLVILVAADVTSLRWSPWWSTSPWHYRLP